MTLRDASSAGALVILVALVAFGCSHTWELLEPLGGTSGSGGASAATSGNGGAGGAGSAMSSTASAGGATSASSAASSAASTTGSGGLQASYKATVAVCNSAMNLDVAACEMIWGPGIMNVDGATDVNTVTRGFLRFDLDDKLAGKTFDSVTLRLVASGIGNASSDMSGEIWQVAPFTLASLATAQPMVIGGAPVSADLGPVVPFGEYLWPIPVGLVKASASVYLGLFHEGGDGVDYSNDHGIHPPMLLVDYH